MPALPDPSTPGDTEGTRDAGEADSQLLELEVGAIAAGGGWWPGSRRQGGLRAPQPPRRESASAGHGHDLVGPAGRRRRDPDPVS